MVWWNSLSLYWNQFHQTFVSGTTRSITFVIFHSCLYWNKTNSDVHVQAEIYLLIRIILNRTKCKSNAYRCRRHRSGTKFQVTKLLKWLLFIFSVVNDLCFAYFLLCRDIFSSAVCVTQIFDIWIFPHTQHFALQNKNPSPNRFLEIFLGLVISDLSPKLSSSYWFLLYYVF